MIPPSSEDAESGIKRESAGSGGGRLRIRAATFAEACAFVDRHHRHHRKPQGHKFSLGVQTAGRLCGVAIVGRPVARRLDNGLTLEVTRLCTDGTPNAASKLYGACRRAAAALGYEKIITYTLASEPGTSLFASGWDNEGEAGGGSWSKPSRPRIDKAPTDMKTRWAVQLTPHHQTGATQ